jgi:hypothetical protein
MLHSSTSGKAIDETPNMLIRFRLIRSFHIPETIYPFTRVSVSLTLRHSDQCYHSAAKVLEKNLSGNKGGIFRIIVK